MVYPVSWKKPVVVFLFLMSVASRSDCNVLSMLQISFKMVVLTKTEITYSLNFLFLKKEKKTSSWFPAQSAEKQSPAKIIPC